jgi:hypothetical protein
MVPVLYYMLKSTGRKKKEGKKQRSEGDENVSS